MSSTVYTWGGSSFTSPDFITSHFMLSSSDGNTYFYEQNYMLFFPVTFSSEGAPYYTGNGQGVTLPVNTSLLVLTGYASYITAFDASIYQTRANSFLSDPTNVLDAANQQPTSLVTNSTTAALTANANLQQALQNATGILTDVHLNFAMKDIMNSWPGGSSIISMISSFLANHQNLILGSQLKIQKLIDFKQALISQSVQNANKQVAISGQLNTWQNQGTFTGLASAFPTVSTLTSSFSGQNTQISQNLTKFIPGSAASGDSTISSIFGNAGLNTNSLPPILNPMDKFIIDLGNLNTSNVPYNGFSSLAQATNHINQLANLLNNIHATMPITPQGVVKTPVTNPATIYTTATQYANAQNGITTTVSASATALANLAKTTSVIASSSPTLGSNASMGGSLANNPSIASVIPSNLPPVPDYNITTSPDPEIASTQNNINNQQVAANATTTTMMVSAGDCINNIADVVPLKPRCKPFNGSLGDFNGSNQIPLIIP